MRYELPLAQATGQGHDSFCVYPWKHLEVRRDGTLDFCCKFRRTSPLAAADGTPLSVTKHSLDEIWNGEQIRGIRRDMVEGRVVSGCEVCHEREAAGYPSDRLQANLDWRDGWLNEDRLTVEQFKARAAADGFRDPAPAYVEIRAGNLCNLKCRMCYGYTSSRIALDPVHSQWAGSHVYTEPERWWQDRAVLDKLFQHPGRVRRLYLLGGEPFLVKELGGVLQHLIDRGVAQDVVVEMSTNGTTTRAPWLPLTRAFKRLDLFLSIDGYGELNHYIRYPSRWDTLVKNIEFFKTLPNTRLSTTVCLQAYNALYLADLFRFFDSAGLPLGYVYPIDHPEHLRTTVLPAAARRLAADRLRAYAGRDCRPENREVVLGLAKGLEPAGGAADEHRLREFMLFTNDLDASRGQSFREACPELHDLIVRSGAGWTGASLLRSSEARYRELEDRHEPLTCLSGLLREVARRGWRKISRNLARLRRRGRGGATT
jgi:MoaA/NifB/PqqE/SkfB family radical SAM enzyme